MRWYSAHPGDVARAAHAKLQARRLRESEPHKWFAWHPVRVDRDIIVWLEYVTRRRCESFRFPDENGTGGGFTTWVYSLEKNP